MTKTKHLSFLLLAAILSGCAAIGPQQSGPQKSGPETSAPTATPPPAAINISSDTVLFTQTLSVITQQQADTVRALVYGGRVLVYGTLPTANQHDQLQRTLRQTLRAKALHWHVEVANTPTSLPFQEQAQLSTAAETALARIPGVNSLNFRMAISETGHLYIIGQADDLSQKNQILATLSALTGLRGLTDYIEPGAKLF